MPWFRLDENVMDHPKFLALSDGAWRLWCEGQSYCQKHLTDGLIVIAALRGFRYFSTARMKQLTATLVPDKGPCWHVLKNGSIQVHDYFDWNDPREAVLKARQESKDRKQRWKDKNASVNASQNASGDARGLSEVGTSTERSRSSNDHERTGSREASNGGNGSQVTTYRGNVGMGGGSGVMAGALPREHLRHVWCGRVCVPDFLHGQFLKATGADDEVLRAFYRDTFANIPDTQAVESDALKFWRPLVTAHWPPVAPPAPPGQSMFAPGTSTEEITARLTKKLADERAAKAARR